MTARRSRLRLVLGLGLLALVCAGLAAAANPVTGSVFGPVTSVSGSTFKVQTTQSPTGVSTVTVGSATVIDEQVAGTRGELKVGACVTANGQKGSKGAIAAVRITVFQPVGGKCTGSGGRPGGSRPGTGTKRPPSAGNGSFANFGFAAGAISAVKGSTLTVHGQSGSTAVTVSGKTQISEQKRVARAAIAVKSCVSVFGTSADGGVTVKARRIEVSKATSSGCARPGFRRG